MSKRYEFCDRCGSQVFDKPDQPETKSKWDRLLNCGSCGKDSKVIDTISLVEEIHQGGILAGTVKLRYLQFPKKGE